MNALERKSLVGLASLYAFRMLGLFMLLPVLALYGGQYLGATEFLVGLALGVYGLSQGLLQIPLGILSDRIGRKPVIVGGMLLFLAGSVVAARSDTMWGLIAGRAMQGAGAVASTIMALLSDLTAEQNRTKAMAAVGGSIGLSFALAMVLGPLVAHRWGLAAVFWLTAVLASVGILIVVYLVPSPGAPSPVAAREALPVPGLIMEMFRNRELLRLDLGIFVLHMVQMASWVSVPVVLATYLDFGAGSHWWLYLLTMGGGFVAMIPFILYAETRRQMKPVFLGAIGLLAVAELLLGNLEGEIPGFAFALFLFFMAFNLLEATLPSLVSKIAPGGSRGTAMGIYSSSQFLGAFVGGVAGGWVAQHYSFQAVFWFASAVVSLWLLAAMSMAPPKHWVSLVLTLEDNEEPRLEQYVGKVAGVEDLVVIPDQRLAYFKVDKGCFDRDGFEQVFGRSVEGLV